MMVAAYLVVAGFLLARTFPRSVYTNSLMEQVAASKRQETVARERIRCTTWRAALP